MAVSPGSSATPHVAIIGGGPSGLIAAETLSAAGLSVTIYERMPTPGRKFLMAGRGGLNLTHSESLDNFMPRYGMASDRLQPIVEAFPPEALRAWSAGLGQPTFIGSSGRVFPEAMKAAPLLRAWLRRLDASGVKFQMRTTWLGWAPDGALLFQNAVGETYAVETDATILALGGASWPRLGSNGAWVDILRGRDIDVASLKPSNCGFSVTWSAVFRERFAGQPLKNIALSFAGQKARGEAMITDDGIEGGVVYALSAPLRDALVHIGSAVAMIDLRPDLSTADLAAKLARPRGSQSLATHLRKTVHLSPLAINLLRETEPATTSSTLAARIKSVPVRLLAPRPIERAISSAGGVSLSMVDDSLMLRNLPGIFVAGEMLDWEAPTGGYLLQACFATGIAAARGVIKKLGCGNSLI